VGRYHLIFDMPVKVGVCGFPVRREVLFQSVDVIEVQRTFYQIEKPSKYSRLRAETPPHIDYTVKAWQGVTHKTISPTWRRFKGELEGNPKNYGGLQPTKEVLKSFRHTLEIAYSLKATLILLQLPPSLKWEDYMTDTLRVFSEESGVRLAIEPREESWFRKKVLDFLRKNRYILVTDPFNRGVVDIDPEIIYLRLHGIGGYRYRYSENDLKRLYNMIKGKTDVKTIYILFNNLDMFRNAVEFKKLVASRE